VIKLGGRTRYSHGVRIGIVGTGWVGASVAISVLHDGTARELLLHDTRAEVAEGEAMDLRHGSSFYPAADVRAVGLDEMVDCDAVVLAAGHGGTAGQSRLELLRDNALVAREVGARLADARGVIVVVSNPVDVMTQLVVEASGLPPERVVGTGTMLDTARLRQILGRELGLEPRSIHGQVIGEHGDTEVVLWSAVEIGGRRLCDLPRWDRGREPAVTAELRGAAGEIIRRKGATNHAIGLVTAALLRWILRGERRVLTVSRVHDGAAGITGVALSLPTVVGRDGATEVIVPEMDDGERAALVRSAEVLRAARSSLS
jgi:L-lactate dehydrogenase